MTKWETCTMYFEREGFFSERYFYTAKKITASEETVIATSIKHKDAKVAHQQLISHLVGEGWEPASSNHAGMIMTMKRQIGGGSEAAAPNITTNPIDLLQQLDNLRVAGILTDKEFQLKKAEILKRM